MAKIQDHAHKYTRVKLGKNGYTVFRCVKPGCRHYIRQELAIGMLYECWRCGGEFAMTQKTVQLKKPHCSNCTRPYAQRKVIKPKVQQAAVAPVDMEELMRKLADG